MKRIPKDRMLAVLLLLILGTGFFWAVAASAAQWMYFGSKYGTAKGDVERIAAHGRIARKLYPHNYFFSLLVAEQAWNSREGLPRDAAHVRFTIADEWCAIGLSQNPRSTSLNRLRTYLLAYTNVRDAARYWERYVEWDYWDPSHHALLVTLHAESGDYDRALYVLQRIKGTADHESASGRIRRAWEREMQR